MKLKLVLLTGLLLTTSHAADTLDGWDYCSDVQGPVAAVKSGTSASTGFVAYQKVVGDARDVIADNKATQKEVEAQIVKVSQLLETISSQGQKEQLSQILEGLNTKLEVVKRSAVTQSSKDGFTVTK